MRIILVQLQRLPATSLGCYGCWQHQTPHLDALAARGLVIEQFMDFEQCQSSMAEVLERLDSLEIVRFDNEEILEELTAEDWESGGGSWLGHTAAELDDVPELLTAFLLQPAPMSDAPLPVRLALHATCVRVMDRLWGEFRQDLQEQLEPGDVVAVLGITGEPLVEREAALELQPYLQPELQHLPLLIEQIGVALEPRRLSHPMGRADLLDLLKRLPIENGWGTWAEQLVQRPAAIHNATDHQIIRTSEWWMVTGTSQEEERRALYRQPEDPWCLLNVAAQFPQVVQSLQRHAH